jgi:uncharacterized protein DUF3710
VFGRRRNAGARDSEAAADLTAQASEDFAGAGEAAAYRSGEAAAPGAGGPWDIAEPHTDLQRVDLGSLQVPVLEGLDIQLIFTEAQGACVMVQHQGSELQLMAFAAPKRDSLWDDVREEIATEIAGGGGVTSERQGPFGTELLARVPAEPGQPKSGLRPVRFTGVDGPRWFLRGLYSGPAAENAAAAAPLEALMREVVVNRGEHPVPPRDLLELRLPPEAAQALAEEQARAEQENNRFATQPNPFDRGPEMTETR